MNIFYFYGYFFLFFVCMFLVQSTGNDVRPFQLTVEKLEISLKEAKQEVIFNKV